jgi:mycofactocin precursor
MAAPPAAPEGEHPMSDLSTAVQTHDEPVVEEELLVEEVSIDGMCGVY